MKLIRCVVWGRGGGVASSRVSVRAVWPTGRCWAHVHARNERSRDGSVCPFFPVHVSLGISCFSYKI